MSKCVRAAANSRDVHVGMLLTGVTGFVAALLFRVWHASMSVPQLYVGDGTFYNMLTKGIDENGGYLTNDLLGYPKGLSFADYPLGGDNLNLLLIRLVSWFSPNFVVTVNLWVLLTFPLVAVCAFIALRRLGAGLWTSALAGFLYTFIPYHFRASGWLLLIGYFALPFGILLAVRVMQGVDLFARRAGATGILSWCSRRSVATLATAVAIGSTGIYMAAFTLVLLSVAALSQFAARRPRVGAMAVLGMGAIVAMTLINTAPTLIQRMTDGANEEVPVRLESESEIYGLTLARMVIPPANHRFGPAREFGERYQATTTLPLTGERAGYIGVVGLAGLALLAIGALVALTRGLSGDWRTRYGPLAVCASAAFVFATVGGANTVFSYLVSPALRGLGRISAVLTFCGIAAVALAMDDLARRWRTRSSRGRAVALPAALATVAALGIYDQTANEFTAEHYQAIERQWETDRDFVKAIEREVPRASAIYTYPEQYYPEGGGPGRMSDYDSGIGYLHSAHLRWSYGAVRGRDGKWLEAMARLPLESKVPLLARCGFAGIWIDRAGLDAPDEAIAEVAGLTRTTATVSDDGRRSFFDIRSLGRGDGAGSSQPSSVECDQTFNPVFVQSGSGIEHPVPDGAGGLARWMTSKGAFTVRNDLADDRRVEMRFQVQNTTGRAIELRLGAGANTTSIQVPAGGPTPVRALLTLPAGRSDVAFDVPSERGQDRVLVANQFEFIDLAG